MQPKHKKILLLATCFVVIISLTTLMTVKIPQRAMTLSDSTRCSLVFFDGPIYDVTINIATTYYTDTIYLNIDGLIDGTILGNETQLLNVDGHGEYHLTCAKLSPVGGTIDIKVYTQNTSLPVLLYIDVQYSIPLF